MLLSKVGTFSLNTGTGNQQITSVGFTPKVVLLFGNPLTADGVGVDFNFFLGAGTSATARGVATLNDEDGQTTSDSTRSVENGRIISMLDPGLTTYLVQADLVSMDYNGFTINITSAPVSAYRITYLALGGGDLKNVKVGNFDHQGTTGNQAVATVGFQPDAVIFFWDGDTFAGSPGNDGEFNIGFALSTSSRATMSISTDNGTAADLAASYKALYTDGCLSEIYYTDGSLHQKADFVSFDTNGFTVNWSAVDGGLDGIHYIALKGGEYALGVMDTQTGTGTFSETGLSFQPSAGLFLSNFVSATGSIQSPMELSFGAADMSGNQSVVGGVTDSFANPSNTDAYQDDALVYKNYTTVQTVDGTIAFSTWNSDGFTLNQTDADPSANKLLYFVMGSSPAEDIGAAPHLVGWKMGQRIPFERFELNVDHPLAKGIVTWIPAKPQLGINPPRDASLYKWPLTTYGGGAVGFVLDAQKGWVREFDDAGGNAGILSHYAYQFTSFTATIIVDVNLHDMSISNMGMGMFEDGGSGGMYLYYRLADLSVVARLWDAVGGTSTCLEVDSNVTTNEWRQWCGAYRGNSYRALFIDAVQQQQSTTLRTDIPGPWNVCYGVAYYSGGTTFGSDNYLGDGVIWDRGLSNAEIEWYYNEPFALYRPVAMPAYYSFPISLGPPSAVLRTSGILRGVLRGVS